MVEKIASPQVNQLEGLSSHHIVVLILIVIVVCILKGGKGGNVSSSQFNQLPGVPYPPI